MQSAIHRLPSRSRGMSAVRFLAALAIASSLLAGCGGGNDNDAEKGAGDRDTSTKSTPTTSASASADGDSIPEASMLKVPKGGPKTVTEFPIPKGAKIVDLGPPLSGNWQFFISSPDPQTTLKFYRKELASEGYKLKQKATVTVGVNKVEYDLAFYGQTYGIVDEAKLENATLVTVDDDPIKGLEP